MQITNSHGRGKKNPQWFWIAATLLGAATFTAPGHAQSVASAFKASYKLNNIGVPTGLSNPSGAIAFPSGDTSHLYVAGGADTSSGAIYSIGVTRDGNNHIVAFSGSLAKISSAPDIDGGLVIGPGGVGLYTTYPDNALGEILPGGTSPAKTVNLTSLGVVASTGGLGLVPSGFPNAGHLKIDSYDRGAMYDTTLSAGSGGTLNVSAATTPVYFGSSVESAAFIPAGNPDFSANTVLVCNAANATIQAYPADSNANPIVTSESDFITGVTNIAGAVVDPLTHDLLVEDQGTNGVLVISGFANAVLSSLSPSTATAGTSFTLTVNGSGFLPGACVMWNGTKLTTTVVSASQVTASVPSSVNGLLPAYPGKATICVMSADGTNSNTLNLSIAAPPTSIASLLPNSVKANAGFTLTVFGANFQNGAVICWNGTPVTTRYISSTDLTAQVTTAINTLAPPYPNTATITVKSPGSLVNPTAQIAVTEPTPGFTGLSPSVVPAGQASFSLNIYGSGYDNGAKVNWNGTPLPTYYISSTQLTADVDASLVAAPGTAVITITNATTGGTSGTRNLTIEPTTIGVLQGISGRNPTTGVITLPLYIINMGNGTAASLAITSATINITGTSVPVPISLGTLVPNDLAVTTLTFPGSAGPIGSSQKLTVKGTYTGGTFQYVATITLP